jgi:hypothetical protein
VSIEERIAAMRAAHAAQGRVAPDEKTVHIDLAKLEVAVDKARSGESVPEIANNTVVRILDRRDLSDKAKLEAVVVFLTARENNYNDVQRNFAEFEAFFTDEQSKRTQVSEQHIQRLMAELEDGTKSTIEHILHDFNIVNAGAGNIKQLLRVMEKARVDGTTVEILTDAYRLNEKLLTELTSLKERVAADQEEEVLVGKAHNRLQIRKSESEQGALNKFLNIFGNNEAIEYDLIGAIHRLSSIKLKVQHTQRLIGEKEGQRNKKLEDGELVILRTVDATEGGFTDQILETAKDSLALIKGTRASIEKLIAANAKSRATSAEIAKSLSATTGRETILKGALQVVAKQTHLQGEKLGAEVEMLTQEKAKAAGDEGEVTLITVRLDKVSQANQGALEYERVLETKVVSFEMLASANVQAEARAQQFDTLVESHHELLSNLQQQALPVTASALEMGLQQGIALRDGLLAAGVRDATKKAEVIFGSNLEGATEAQIRIEAENLDQMRVAIAALDKAQTLITGRTDQAIEHGLASLELVEKVTASAEAVRAAMSDFQKVGALMSSREGVPASSASVGELSATLREAAPAPPA